MKKELNDKLNSYKKSKMAKMEYLQNENFYSNEIPSNIKVNLSSTLKHIIKRKNQKKGRNINNAISKIISNNLRKYNSNSTKLNVMIVNNLINCKSCHFLAVFKDYLITDYVEEFLRRIYLLKESVHRMPKLYNYYKNYLLFFCKPTFIDSFSNEVIKNYGDLNAEYFYKNKLDRKKNKKDAKKVLDKNINYRNFNKDDANENEELIKTVFTKSIKNSIDNINIEEDSIIINKKLDNDKINNDKIHQDSIVNIIGSENGNLISEGNSILLMINEIKDYKNKKFKKEKTTTSKINKNRKINLNNLENTNSNNNQKKASKYGSIMSSYKTLIINKNNDNNHKYKSKNIKSKLSTISKTNTYMSTSKNFNSIEKLIYSPKSKKNGKFSIQKGKVKFNKTERYLSPCMNKTCTLINKTNANNNTTNVNTKTIANNKNHNSIVVNINININTNENNTIANDTYKSPIHKINKNKFPLSPLSPVNFNSDKEFSQNMPSTTRNKNEIKTSNYVKIMKRKNDYNNLVLSSQRNNKIDEIKKMKTLNSIDINEYRNKLNSTCNKDNLFYNKKKNRIANQINEYTLNKVNMELYTTNYNSNINKNVYFSPKIREKKSRFIKSMKDLDNISQLNTKNFIYQKKQNTINSPLNKNSKMEKKYFSYGRLDNLENLKI
jgi:hypothetical protein